jgi:amidase
MPSCEDVKDLLPSGSKHLGNSCYRRPEIGNMTTMPREAPHPLFAALSGIVLAGCARSPGPAPDIDALIDNGSIPQLEAAMDANLLTAEALTQEFLDRIERRNGELHAVIDVSPHALEDARLLDFERAAGRLRGPLHGIPVLIKDNIETRDLPTTAGSLALAGNRTGRDAPLVSRLRAAGAIILGKTNLSEWANFRSERSSSGWSGVGGQTRNPHDPNRSPCGSSSGSAVAVAAHLAVAAIGTETNGSIVCPSSVNGVVGVKPTVGLVSRTGIVPIAHTQDTAGPMTRNVTDAAIMLSVLAGLDERDPATVTAAEHFGQNYRNALDADALRGARIGVLRSAAGFNEDVDALLARALEALRQAGAVVIDNLQFSPPQGFDEDRFRVLLYEFKHDLNEYLATLPPPRNALDLAALIDFNAEHAATEMPYFRQSIFEKAEAMGPLSSEAYQQALTRIDTETREHGIDRLLSDYQLDVLIAPTKGPAWTIDLINGDHQVGGFSTYAAVAGYPHVTVPMGDVHGLPIGLSFVGPVFGETELLAIAFAYEQLTP